MSVVRVLVVDDLEDSRRSISSMLGAEPFEITGVQELVEATHSIVRGKKFVSRSLAGHGFLDGF
jgi:CheY-like chemotaxis protein